MSRRNGFSFDVLCLLLLNLFLIVFGLCWPFYFCVLVFVSFHAYQAYFLFFCFCVLCIFYFDQLEFNYLFYFSCSSFVEHSSFFILCMYFLFLRSLLFAFVFLFCFLIYVFCFILCVFVLIFSCLFIFFVLFSIHINTYYCFCEYILIILFVFVNNQYFFCAIIDILFVLMQTFLKPQK